VPAPKCTDEAFIALWEKHTGYAPALAKELDIGERQILSRRRSIERRHGLLLKSPKERAVVSDNKRRIDYTLDNGTVVVFSDAHFYPGDKTTAFRALPKLIKRLKPQAVICNGDAFDGATISRHPRIGWDSKPSVKQELEAVQDALEVIQKAATGAKLFWPLGNHDSRFECRLAAQAPEFQGVKGFALKDHFPAWTPCWAAFINDDTVVKHRWHNGTHAVFNNTVKSGRSIVTGHLHSLKVTPWTDYNGDRYGVDTGTLADVGSDQFDYLEENPVNWRSGFVVLTFKDGELMPPELVQKVGEGQVFFRGEVIAV